MVIRYELTFQVFKRYPILTSPAHPQKNIVFPNTHIQNTSVYPHIYFPSPQHWLNRLNLYLNLPKKCD